MHTTQYRVPILRHAIHANHRSLQVEMIDEEQWHCGTHAPRMGARSPSPPDLLGEPPIPSQSAEILGRSEEERTHILNYLLGCSEFVPIADEGWSWSAGLSQPSSSVRVPLSSSNFARFVGRNDEPVRLSFETIVAGASSRACVAEAAGVVAGSMRAACVAAYVFYGSRPTVGAVGSNNRHGERWRGLYGDGSSGLSRFHTHRLVDMGSTCRTSQLTASLRGD